MMEIFFFLKIIYATLPAALFAQSAPDEDFDSWGALEKRQAFAGDYIVALRPELAEALRGMAATDHRKIFNALEDVSEIIKELDIQSDKNLSDLLLKKILSSSGLLTSAGFVFSSMRYSKQSQSASIVERSLLVATGSSPTACEVGEIYGCLMRVNKARPDRVFLRSETVSLNKTFPWILVIPSPVTLFAHKK